jgi:regulation of enolase protein 1 (concanavalin A-like superfamily)
MTTTVHRPAVTTTGGGFGSALRGEWTKLRSVRSTVWAGVATIALTVLISVLAAAGSSTSINDGPHTIDQFQFVYRSLSGDGTIVARVSTQQNTNEWAKAGIMIKRDTTSGSPYTALMVTPRHGVRMQADFETELTGSAGGAPRWLKLTRSGDSITGYESADGATWNRIGTVNLSGLPQTVEVGMFVASPDTEHLTQVGPGSVRGTWTSKAGQATFDHVSVDGASGQSSGSSRQQDVLPGGWRNEDVAPSPAKSGGGLQPSQGGPGSTTEADGVFTVTGVGNLGRIGIGGIKLTPLDDLVRLTLVGVQIGVVVVIALGVLVMTAEYKTGIVRTTFAASPRRGQMLAAKAVVLGVTVFVVGLIASLAAFLFALPVARDNGYAPPAYPRPSLTDGPVLRAVVGTALFLALIGLFSLGVGAIVRRTASAIVIVVALVVVAQIVTSVLSEDTEPGSGTSADLWLNRVTPIAGLAIQQTMDLPGSVIGPWAGLGVLCAYAAVTLGVAYWLLRSRDA